MLSSIARSLRPSTARSVLGEASGTRLLPRSMPPSHPAVRLAYMHSSAVRRADEDKGDLASEPGPVAEESVEEVEEAAAERESKSKLASLSMETLAPRDVLPASFRLPSSSSASASSSSASSSTATPPEGREQRPTLVDRQLQREMLDKDVAEEVYGRSRYAQAPMHRLHIQASRNNIIMTFTTPQGDTLCQKSAGMCGYKKAARSTYEAAYNAAVQIYHQIVKNRVMWRVAAIEMVWKDFGKGREAAYRALLSQEGNDIRNLVTRMTDATPLKTNADRPPKRRML